MGGKWAICWYDSRIRRCGAGDSDSVLWDKRRKHPEYRRQNFQWNCSNGTWVSIENSVFSLYPGCYSFTILRNGVHNFLIRSPYTILLYSVSGCFQMYPQSQFPINFKADRISRLPRLSGVSAP